MTDTQPPFTGSELTRLQAHEVVELLRKGEVSPAELVDASLARIEQVDGAVNAMPVVCADRARAAANHMAGDVDHPGWLGGLPIGIKDLTPVEGVRTTFGTKFYADHVPDQSDPLVCRLEARGAIVMGKTNTPELGAGANTFNDVFGPTFNAYDTTLNAAGSSGGAAVSLATGQVWLSQGSDHGGSLRTPAAYNGIVGLRPSPGRVPGSSDTAFGIEGVEGPMARSVTDCALFLDAMSGFDASSPLSYPAPDAPFQQAVARADGKLRIAFSDDLGGLSPVDADMARYLRRAIDKVAANGAEIEETTPDLSGLERTYHTLRGLGMVALGRNAPAEMQQHFKQTLCENIKLGQTLSVNDVADANLNRTKIYNEIRRLFSRFDVLACPVVGNLPRPQTQEWVREVGGVELHGYMDWLRFAFLATTAGLPAISVPVGLSDEGLPVGLQLIGPPRGEAVVLAAARAVEIAVGGPLPPRDPNVRSTAS
ncbi:amidase [Sulfitobacter sp. SK012]|uniref:amidase n=1 Tax=Sulfitobacter sp. SK012 TaxID=1389005 RepID=UPI000E0AB7A7|nr:amidase family protein [Sulfitobacter sp. SK012]AXI46954.1 amidase [Sulfitobacter sp. SK012]